MSTSLILSFNSAVAKYSRLSKKVRKSISKGEFWRYTRRKRHYLLSRIENLKRRIAGLRVQLKLAGAGLAAGLLMMGAGDASAQTSLGPFVPNPAKNPLPAPTIWAYPDPVLTFVDFDKDGDLDAALMSGYSEDTSVEYFKNIGTKEHPSYEWTFFVGNNPYRSIYADGGRVVFADVDDDGDLDAVVGMSTSDEGADDAEDDVLYFFRNTSDSPTEPPYFMQEFGGPFAGMRVKKESWPAFTDYDKDGDLDFVLAGEYNVEEAEKTAWIQFFRNDKEGHAAGVDPTYTQLEGNENPLFLGESVTTITAGYFDIAFADLDGDGDEDYFAADQHGTIYYKRNDNGTFVEQTGDYTFQPDGASTGNPLEIDNLFVGGPDQRKYLSFGDVDGDGDQDLILGTNAIGTLNPQYIFVENTGNGVMVRDIGFSNPIVGFKAGDNSSFAFLDFDGDGDDDLLTTGVMVTPIASEGETITHVAHVFFENDNGKYEPLRFLDNPYAGLTFPGTDNSMPVDVDGDSDLDVLIFTYGYDPVLARERTFITYHRNDNGTFVTVNEEDGPFKPIGDVGYWGLSLGFGDLDGDNLTDVVLTGSATTPLFFKNVGEIGSPEFELAPSEGTSSWYNGLSTEIGQFRPTLIDLDNDGDNDMILGKYQYVWYYENVGSPTLPSWSEFEEGTPGNPFAFAFAENFPAVPRFSDIDGDGDKDLLVIKQATEGYVEFIENQNPVPTVTPGSTLELTFELGEPLTLAPNLILADADGDDIVRIVITIAPYEAGLEQLALQGNHEGLTATWDDAHGTLTITGHGDIDSFQAALRDVVYIFTGGVVNEDRKSGRTKSPAGRAVSKTVTITTLDSDLTVGPDNTTVFQVTGDDGTVNTPPAISGPATTFYVSGEVVVNPNIVLVDADTVLSGAQVVFTTGYLASEDELLFENQNDIVGNFNSTAGLLTLTGTASVANYQTALRSIRYRNDSDEPSTEDRSLNFIVDDGEAPPITLTGTVIVINKPPVITPQIKKAAASGNIAIAINQLVSDPDDNLDLETLAVTSQAGGRVTIENGIVTVDYSAVPNFQGNDVLTITVCDVGGRCNTTQMQVEVSADVFVYTGMSPNGDNVNDYFHIDFLPEGTQVAIYNRWGEAVYEESQYDVNDPSKRFEGKNKNGTELIAGSYYYKVKYPDGRVKTGNLLLNR